MARQVRSFTVVENRFPQVRRLAKEHVRESMDKARKAGEEEAKNRLKPGRGIDTGRTRDNIYSEVSDEDAKVVSPGDPETLKNPAWLEFGTAHSKAVPHIRPANTRMKKTFLQEVDGLGIEKLRTRKFGGQQRRRR